MDTGGKFLVSAAVLAVGACTGESGKHQHEAWHAEAPSARKRTSEAHADSQRSVERASHAAPIAGRTSG